MIAALFVYFICGVVVATATLYAIGIPKGRHTIPAGVMLIGALFPLLWILFLIGWPVVLALLIGRELK